VLLFGNLSYHLWDNTCCRWSHIRFFVTDQAMYNNNNNYPVTPFDSYTGHYR